MSESWKIDLHYIHGEIMQMLARTWQKGDGKRATSTDNQEKEQKAYQVG
jgi:hypothetical protein